MPARAAIVLATLLAVGAASGSLMTAFARDGGGEGRGGGDDGHMGGDGAGDRGGARHDNDCLRSQRYHTRTGWHVRYIHVC